MAEETIITGIALKKTYGAHAVAILSGKLEALPRERKKGAKQKYKVIATLPDKEEFATLRARKFTTTLDALVSDAFGEFESLKDELQEWYDSIPENLQNGQKGDDLQSAIDTFDNLQAPDVPDYVANLETVYIPGEKVTSRPDRRDEAASRIANAIDILNDAMDDEDSEVKYTEAQKEEMQQLVTDLEEAQGEAEGVEFPTMFG